MKKLLFFVAALISGSAFGAVTLNLNLGSFRDADGIAIDSTDLVMVVADVASDGFDEPVLGDFLGGTDDDVVAASFDLGSNTLVQPGAAIVSLTGLSLTPAGAPLRVLWFPENQVGDTDPMPHYGTFTDATWVIPADGATVTLSALDTSLGGTIDELRAVRVDAAIPEPSVLTLSALFGLFFLLRRKR